MLFNTLKVLQVVSTVLTSASVAQAVSHTLNERSNKKAKEKTSQVHKFLANMDVDAFQLAVDTNDIGGLNLAVESIIAAAKDLTPEKTMAEDLSDGLRGVVGKAKKYAVGKMPTEEELSVNAKVFTDSMDMLADDVNHITEGVGKKATMLYDNLENVFMESVIQMTEALDAGREDTDLDIDLTEPSYSQNAGNQPSFESFTMGIDLPVVIGDGTTIIVNITDENILVNTFEKKIIITDGVGTNKDTIEVFLK